MSTSNKKKPVERVVMHIPAPRDLVAKIDSAAVREDRSRTKMVIMLCRQALEQAEENQQQAM